MGYQYDPTLDPYANGLPSLPSLGSLGSMGVASQLPQQQGQRLPPMSKEEEDSLLGRLGSATLSGLGYVGGVLDKTFGGRAVRGLLGGQPRELLSLLPGSDTLGITHEADQVSGRQLLENAGVLDPRQQGDSIGTGDLAGMAAEIALDPATYLTLGASALTDAGKAAKEAGTLAPTMAGRIAAGQGGLAGLGLPFADPSIVLGTGAKSQRVAQGLGSAYDTLRYGKVPGTNLSPGAQLSALFDPTVEGSTSPLVQKALRAQAPQTQREVIAGRQALGEAGLDLAEASGGKISGDTSQGIRALMENQPVSGANGMPLQATDTASTMQDLLLNDLTQSKALGAPIGELENYAPRQQTQVTPGGKRMGSMRPDQVMSPFNVHQIGRNEMFDELDQLKGTAGINELMKDPLVSGPAERTLPKPTTPALQAMEDKAKASLIAKAAQQGLTPDESNLLRQMGGNLTGDDAAAYIGSKYLGYGPVQEAVRTHLANKADFQGLTADEAKILDQANATREHVQQLAQVAGAQPAERAQQGLDYFGNNIFYDVEHRLSAGAEARGRLRAIHGAIQSVATPTAQAGPGAVTLDKVLDQLGLVNQVAKKALASKLGKALKNLAMPAQQADELTRYVQSFNRPEAMNGLLQAFDSITNLTKAGVTAVWPAKYARDFTQGVFMNWVKGASDPRFSSLSPRAWLQPYQDAKQLFRSGERVLADANTIPGLTRLSPQEASKQLLAEAYAYKIAGPERFASRVENVGAGAVHAAQDAITLPGDAQPGLGRIVSKPFVDGSKSGTLNPLDIAGVGDRVITTNRFAKAGGEAMDLIDDLNRGAAYIAKRRQGFAPQAAAQAVTEAQYNYGNLSQFEKSVMKRAVPFYSWMRQNIPATLTELARKPGGKMAASIRATGAMRHDQGFVPDYVGEGLAVPLGKEEEGTQRFLSHFGLPFEDAFSDLGTGPNSASRTLQNLLSETNPLIKAPLELAAGKQFMSGRQLQDLYGPTGNTLADQAIFNSPISRFVSTARTLADERKGVGAKALNLLSPLRVTDVDLDKQRAIAAREQIQEMMMGNPLVHQFSRTYVRPEDVGSLSPRDLQLMRLNATLEKRKAG